ncbi:MAG: caspase family protein [Phycisphaerales bacterium]|jgi:hypothetical protein|nr:caspase family protein [Phycisphaerales bacterium]
MRKALVVGINHYDHVSSLYGCVDDAHAAKQMLERNGDGTMNFGVKLLTGTGPKDRIIRPQLKDAVSELFEDKHEISLFYFAGHGHITSTGGYILTSDATRGDDGVSLSEVLALAGKCESDSRVIILDSCHSGIAGTPPGEQSVAVLKEGMTILTASTEAQYASEQNGSGVFTSLLVDALSGPAANLIGAITPGSIYAHIDQALGPWQQRPVFKTNVKNFVPIRRVQPPISLEDLHRLVDFFPQPGVAFPLDPSYEPETRGREPGMVPPDPENTRKFAILQRFNRLNLVVPVDAPHMWHAAMQSKSCRLTAVGEHWRKLVERKLI